jgi:vacuolar-type H+-ATPase subunit H
MQRGLGVRGALQKGAIMREVIERLLQVEAAARGRVEQARAEGEQMVREARQKAAESISQAVQEGRAQANAAVQAAVTQAEQEREQLLQAAAKRLDEECRLPNELREELVGAIVERVCTA